MNFENQNSQVVHSLNLNIPGRGANLNSMYTMSNYFIPQVHLNLVQLIVQAHNLFQSGYANILNSMEPVSLSNLPVWHLTIALHLNGISTFVQVSVHV